MAASASDVLEGARLFVADCEGSGPDQRMTFLEHFSMSAMPSSTLVMS